MLTFMNSKLTKITGRDKQNYILQKCKSYEISSTGIYIDEDLEFIMHMFYSCVPYDHKIYAKCKKSSNLIKGISSHNIFSGIKSQQIKITICWKLTKEKFTLHEDDFGGAAKVYTVLYQ